tara:strand:- start:563 stop:946 length:384 start_codon:yes stop_codon:yes gene_type:complete
MAISGDETSYVTPTDVTPVSEEIDFGELGTTEIRGDAELAALPAAEKHFDDAQIRLWKNQLQIAYPDTDESLLNELLKAYQTHPNVVSQIVQEYKDGEHQVDHKDRVSSGTIEGCVSTSAPEPKEKV